MKRGWRTMSSKVIFSCSRPFAFFSRLERPVFSSIAFQERTANLPFVQEDNVNTALQASLHS